MMENAAEAPPASLRVYLLGTFGVEKIMPDSLPGSQEKLSIHLPTRKIESLLAYVILNHGPHSREKLAAQFWGDFSDRQARDSLRNAFTVLRKRLGDNLLITTRESAQLNPEFPLWSDVADFKKQSETAPQVAIHLYRGDLLTDYYEDWIQIERDEYRNLYLNALLQVTQQFRAQSDYEHAIETAHIILKLDAANERAHQNLMFCYISIGNRGAALQQYEECKRLLHEELDVEPSPETTALYQWIKQTKPGSPAIEARLTNLPIPLTSFIGRQREIEEVKVILKNTRLLTLTGAGGSGKTRLAIQAAKELLSSVKDGVWWVDLASLNEELSVARAVAKTLGVQENAQQPLIESLVNNLRKKQLLLILDNCEHLLNPCVQLITALLSECPHVQILVTSRERLGILGERTWLVPTMTLPGSRAISMADMVLNFESIRLFFERAIAVKPDFTLTEHNASTVIEICRRLDGIPLAIEMAAARVQVLSVQEIAARLDARFNLLTTGERIALPRHQTLHALISWSYDLLSPGEQTLLNRLSVFAGGFTLDAAEMVCANGELLHSQILDLLSHLVTKSLVMVEVGEEEARYRMLETIRQYSNEKLKEVGEMELVSVQHLDFFLRLAEKANTRLNGNEQLAWLKRLEAEHDNLQAALAEGMKHDIQSGLRLAISLWQFWILRGHLIEGQQALRNLLAKMPERSPLRAEGLRCLAAVGFRQGYTTEVETLLVESLSIYQELEDQRSSSRVYQFLGACKLVAGKAIKRARIALNKSLDLALASGSNAERAVSTYFLGVIFDAQGDYEQAKILMEKSLTQFRELGDQPEVCSVFLNVGLVRIGRETWHTVDEETILLLRRIGTRSAIGYTLVNLGLLARGEEDYPRAQVLLEESLEEFRAVGDRAGIGQVLGQLGNLRRISGDYKQARTLLQASLDLRREIGERRGIGRTLCSLGYLSASEGDYEMARTFFNQSLELFQEKRDDPGIAATFSHLGNLSLAEGNYAQAESLYARSYDIFQKLKAYHAMTIILLNLATCALRNGDYLLARSRLEECLKYFEEIVHKPGIAYIKNELINLSREFADHRD